LEQRLCGEFFKTLKAEVDNLEGRRMKEEVRDAVFEYMKMYQNKYRRDMALGYAYLIALTHCPAA
jgi:hypothetical protein